MAGIEQLVDMYKGNPGPLDAKVKEAQQGQQPGELPEDLEEAIALQKIAELQNGAKNQQAMQAGGAQPSIVEKLKQMLAAQQRQQAQPPQMPQNMPPQQGMPQMAQGPQGGPPQGLPQGQPQGMPPAPQGQPVMAAGGGSIDQLMSNLGRHYAGGGIIAFEEGGKAPTEEELEAQRKADREKIDALARALGETGGEYAGKSMAALADIASLIPRGLAGAVDTAVIRPARALGAKVDYLSPALTPGNQSSDTMTPFYDRYIRAKEGAAPASAEAKGPAVVATPAATLDAESEKLKRLAAARSQTGVSTNPDLVPRKPIVGASPDDAKPKPSAGGGVGGAGIAGARPAAEAMDPMETALRATIMKALAKDEDAEWRKGSKRYEDFMGIDKLLQPREARITEREAMLKKIQGERTPAWVDALVAAGKPVRGGLGTLLSQMGSAADATRKGYSAEDLKFFDEIGAMRDEVVKLKLEGKYKAAAAGEAAIKDALADKRQAESSGTSLLNTKENVRSREQIAADNRAARAQSAAQHADTRADALAERKRQFDESELRKIREKDVERAVKIEAAIAKRTGLIDMQLQNPKLDPDKATKLMQQRDAIVKQVQAEYPPIKPEKPSESQFLAAARAANPGVSDEDLKAYYKKTYGK